jgi:hypothetical protein
MYTYFGGVSALTICDNLRSGVTHPDRYEAEVNATYRDFASHFGSVGSSQLCDTVDSITWRR